MSSSHSVLSNILAPLFLVLATFTVLFTALPFAEALQVSPASYTVIDTQMDHSYAVQVTNDQTYPVRVTFQAEDDAVQLRLPAQLELSAGETRSVVFGVQAAQVEPGYHETRVLIESRAEGEATVRASAAVAHVVRVRIPLEGTHLEASLHFSAASVGEPILFTVPLENIGTQRVDVAHVTLTINGELLEAPAMSLLPGERKNIVVSWTPPEARTYPLLVQVEYGEQSISLDSEVVVGHLSARIVGAKPGAFALGELFGITVLVNNEWGAVLPVHVVAKIAQGSIIHSGESTTVLAPAASTVQIPVYLASNDLKPGLANISLEAHYGQRVSTEEYEAVVSISSIKLLGEGVESESETSWNLQVSRTYIALVLALIVVAACAIYIRKHYKRRS